MESTQHDGTAAAIWRAFFGSVSMIQLVGDVSHLISLVLLCKQIYISRSCKGISLKTVELYAVVFIFRYLDLFWLLVFVSWYNVLMKILFVTVTLSVVYQMRFRPGVKDTYDKAKDTFPYEILLVASILLGCLPHKEAVKGFSLIKVLYHASIYLEAVAIIPQLMMLIRTEEIESLTGNYVLFLGLYRAVYVVKWFHSWLIIDTRYGKRITLQMFWPTWLAGIVQTAIYAEFFYYYIRSWRRNEKLKVPTLCAMHDEDISELADLTCIGAAAAPPPETGLRQRLLSTNTSENELLTGSELEAVANKDNPAGFPATPNAPSTCTFQMPPYSPSKPHSGTPTAVELAPEVDQSSEPEGMLSQTSATGDPDVLQVEKAQHVDQDCDQGSKAQLPVVGISEGSGTEHKHVLQVVEVTSDPSTSTVSSSSPAQTSPALQTQSSS